MNTWVKVALGALVIFAIYWLYTNVFSSEAPVSNQGELNVEVDENGEPIASEMDEEYAPINAVGTYSASGLANQVVRNSQVQTIAPSCDYTMLKNNTNILSNAQPSNNYAPQLDVNQQAATTFNRDPVKLDCFPKDQLTAADLLPREDGFNTWQEVNPQAQGALTDQNFLAAGHNYGINTVGQSLKNANLQLRSDPVIPQVAVGPWQQSTYGPDTNRRFFEIGQC